MSDDKNSNFEAGSEEDFVAQLLAQQQSGTLENKQELDRELDDSEEIEIEGEFLFENEDDEESGDDEDFDEDDLEIPVSKPVLIISSFFYYFLPPIAAFALYSTITIFVNNIIINYISGGIIAVILGIYFLVRYSFARDKDNEQASDILNEIARGKLSYNIEESDVLKSKLGVLAMPIHNVIQEMSDIVAKIELSVLDIVGNSDALSYFASSMAAKTEQQEQSVIKIERSAISLNESMQEVKENGEEVYDNSKESIKEADLSSTEILSLIDDMNSINEMSEKIVATMNFISEIADETNLLALNANIQAAHAGEEGKGFGVVASEIRNLAESSADATKSIFQIIERTVESIEDGVKTSERAKKALEKIINSIKSTEKLTFDIKDSIDRQSETTNSLKHSVEDIQGLTKNINADTQNMKNAIANLAGQAQILNKLIKGFEVSSSSVRSDAIFGVDH